MTARNCPPGLNSPHGDVQSYLQELVKLATSSLMGVIVPMEARLGAATLVASAEYRVPAEYDFAIFQIQSSFRSSDLASEPALNANITAFDLQGLTEARLQNVLVDLKLKDRQLKVIEGDASLNMAALFRSPAFFLRDAPLIIPAGQTLKASFSAQDNTAAVIGNDADYGLVLIGVQIPHVP